MAHRFTVYATIPGVSLSDFKRLSADTSLHEKVCRRIPGDKLEILESRIDQGVYTLKRAYSRHCQKIIKRCFSSETYRYYQS